MVKGVELYLKDGVYAQECVDLIVDAATKLFNVNIGIFQEVNKLIHCINYTAKQPTNRDIFLKYSNEHYEAIVKRVSPKKKTGKSKPTTKDLGVDSENESSRDCLTDSSSEEDLSEVQVLIWEWRRMRVCGKTQAMEKSKWSRTQQITRNGSPT